MKKILVESSYYWARYITDLRMRTYFDITEQLGVQLHQQVDRPYEGGEEIWGLVGTLHTIHIDNVLAKLTKGERWSFYGTSPPRYLSGPVSLINHACHKHRNVSIKPIVEKSPSWLSTHGLHAMACRLILTAPPFWVMPFPEVGCGRSARGSCPQGATMSLGSSPSIRPRRHAS